MSATQTLATAPLLTMAQEVALRGLVAEEVRVHLDWEGGFGGYSYVIVAETQNDKLKGAGFKLTSHGGVYGMAIELFVRRDRDAEFETLIESILGKWPDAIGWCDAKRRAKEDIGEVDASRVSIGNIESAVEKFADEACDYLAKAYFENSKLEDKLESAREEYADIEREYAERGERIEQLEAELAALKGRAS